MTPPRRGNMAASVRQRLLNRAREQREDFGLLLTRFGTERLLYRLGESEYGAPDRLRLAATSSGMARRALKEALPFRALAGSFSEIRNNREGNPEINQFDSREQLVQMIGLAIASSGNVRFGMTEQFRNQHILVIRLFQPVGKGMAEGVKTLLRIFAGKFPVE